MSTKRVGIVGASGYTGLELVRLVRRHPELELVAITSEQRAGAPAGDAFPALRGLIDLTFESFDPKSLAERIDIALCCLPAGPTAKGVGELVDAGLSVVDLAADYRLKDMADYENWYGEHHNPRLFGRAVYGMPELHRKALRGAKFTAAAGCYPTCSMLPLAPFLSEGLVDTKGIVIDAKSGVSGAGRTLADIYLHGELDANAHAYKVGGVHRHVPEMNQQATDLAGTAVRLTFIPHLLPTTRGMLASVVARPLGSFSTADAIGVLERAYAGEPFVRVLGEGQTPSIANVRGTNFCDVTAVVDERAGSLVLLSALDNLGKGASGQMLQCLNLMQGWEETTGLLEVPLLP